MYRQKIQDYYPHLSPSYRRVADFVMSHYYEVVFMTAAQLAEAVEVDTTTIVRFSQRLDYSGYPALLQDVRAHVKEELYAIYEPVSLRDNDPVAIFKAHIDQEGANLRQILVHNPPSRLAALALGIGAARRVLFVAGGELLPVAEMAATQLRQQGALAEAVDGDPARQALALSGLTGEDAVVGICGAGDGVAVARCLAFARQTGCSAFAVVGRLEGAVMRWAEEILYLPTDATGLQTAVVALTGALIALIQAATHAAGLEAPGSRGERMQKAWRFLTEDTAPDT